MIRPAAANDEAAIVDMAKCAYCIYEKPLDRPPTPMVADFGRHADRD